MLGIPAHVRLVVHWHSDILGRRILVQLLAPFIRHTLARADRIVVSSSSIISLSPFLKDYMDKCAVIPFGVDPDYWGCLSQAEQVQVERFRALHPRLIVATGRLVHYKGFDVLIRALREIDGTVLIVGDGPQGGSLRRLAERLGVEPKLIIKGSVPRAELKFFLHAARIFAFPSTTSAETFGIAQLEAMGAGLPVVNTALPTGVPLVARHGRESLTVAPNDASALAAALNRLLDDPALAAKLGQAGRLRASEEFHHRVFVRRVMALYGEVNSGHSGAERPSPA
jgi:rhamnosyl/mannosyltransferase